MQLHPGRKFSDVCFIVSAFLFLPSFLSPSSPSFPLPFPLSFPLIYDLFRKVKRKGRRGERERGRGREGKKEEGRASFCLKGWLNHSPTSLNIKLRDGLLLQAEELKSFFHTFHLTKDHSSFNSVSALRPSSLPAAKTISLKKSPAW